MIEILEIKEASEEKKKEIEHEQPEWKERLLDVFLGGKRCQVEKN